MPDWSPQVWVGVVGAFVGALGVLLTGVVIYLKWKWDRPTVEIFLGRISSRYVEDPNTGEVFTASRLDEKSGDLKLKTLIPQQSLERLVSSAPSDEDCRSSLVEAVTEENFDASAAELNFDKSPESLIVEATDGSDAENVVVEIIPHLGALAVEVACEIKPSNLPACTIEEGEVILHPGTDSLQPERISLSNLAQGRDSLEMPLKILGVQPRDLQFELPINLRLAGSIDIRILTRTGEEASTGKKEIPVGEVPDEALEEAELADDRWWPPWT